MRIRAEEIFRLEVRKELENTKPGPTRRQRLWSWLNSSFGLWLLSSVVLTGLTTGYTYYQNERSEELRKAESELRLDTEIEGRMADALAALSSVRSAIQQRKDCFPHNDIVPDQPAYIYSTVADYLDNFYYISRTDGWVDFSTYPEYQNRSFRSLLFELRKVKPTTVPEIKKALVFYISLRNKASLTKSSSGKCNDFMQVVDDSTEGLQSQMKGRWHPI